MVSDPTWLDVAVRILLATLAGGALGFDRGEHGRAAGMRTVMLVALAAALATACGNLLLGTDGKTNSSFATMDIMRLPLGILTGIGFIGAGAILKRGQSIEGLTTAATLWLATVLGIVFGAGLILLGLAGALLGLAVVSFLRWFEVLTSAHRRGVLTVTTRDRRAVEEVVRRGTPGMHVRVQGLHAGALEDERLYSVRYAVTWRTTDDELDAPPLVEAILRIPGVRAVDWHD